MSKLTKLKTVDKEAAKWLVIAFLKAQAAQSNYWYTMAEIQKGTKMPYASVREAVFAVASEGFIQLRDGDTDNILFHIALKKSLRDERNVKK